MNKEDLYPLIGKYLNGFKIVKIENDPFIKGQINLWTDTWENDLFGDRYLVKFYVKSESGSATIYREVVDEKLKKMEDNWNKLREFILNEGFEINTREYGSLDVIDKNVILEEMQELEKGSDLYD